jgi:hypothetical protein
MARSLRLSLKEGVGNDRERRGEVERADERGEAERSTKKEPNQKMYRMRRLTRSRCVMSCEALKRAISDFRT